MNKLLIILLLFSGTLKAEVTELSVDYRKMKGKRDPYFPDKTDWANYVGLNWGLMGYKTLFWDNKVFFYGDEAQVRYVGWHFDAGLRLFTIDNDNGGKSGVDIYYHHESSHSTDMGRYEVPGVIKPRFPLENSYGIRFNFLEKK